VPVPGAQQRVCVPVLLRSMLQILLSKCICVRACSGGRIMRIMGRYCHATVCHCMGRLAAVVPHGAPSHCTVLSRAHVATVAGAGQWVRT